MYILAIETSCDESAAAVIKGQGKKVEIISNLVSSQINIHKQYGGVIPEIAAREHVLNLLPVIDQVLKKAKLRPSQIKALAVTKGPGLITSLIAGLETVKTLSLAWQKPIIAVNHLSGHIYANFINSNKISFPLISLIVSGGHSSLIYMREHNRYKIIGDTRDDAAGEAYDKAAQMLELSYPGGPIIGKLAEKFKNSKKICQLNFPRPMINSNNLDFSFSGLKTALYYQLKKDKNWSKRKNEYCFAYQAAINDVLINKSLKAIKKYNVKSFLLAGGVSANIDLRKRLEAEIKEKYKKIGFYAPKLEYTTDNAAMIASAAYYLYQEKKEKSFTKWQNLKANPALKLAFFS
jgi:N6-L-threonylcarbamoyladenine synthase